MNSTNHSSTGNANLNQEDLRQAEGATPPPGKPGPKTATPPTIRTAARDYENPVDYDHPYPSMDQFADFLALRYDANRTRCAYYRVLRLIHEHFTADPAALSEAQLRDYFLFVKLQKHWKPKTTASRRRRQNVLCGSARARLDRLFPDPHQRSRHPARGAHAPTGH